MYRVTLKKFSLVLTCLFMGAIDTHVLISMANEETNSSQQQNSTFIIITEKNSSPNPIYTTTISQQTACERTDLGFIEYIHYPLQHECFVTCLRIKDPAERRKGYGTTLMHTLFVNAKKLGCTEIRLRSREGENSPQPFYEKFGFIKNDFDPASGLGLFVLNFTWPWIKSKKS